MATWNLRMNYNIPLCVALGHARFHNVVVNNRDVFNLCKIVFQIL